ncbi:MAG: hypothetical protein Q8S58_07990 [Bosea sp. (in: a-proteobacteria)]|uniref:hypothetical protein n=1 Tax=Bosea sp. (in: a-proteobacteria) TaxID=1871050 RepID=UPI002732C923|nr:hypothetical protein [Bosea sp. (in: a-proteobacteria)]MDP3257082.1 hypothetical protein [Bosea sp. (in: a-proteobacteria)]MDP3319057.1 hypothetical protein [Bosea sp. (in: a-proteobacteria)]
MGSSTLIIAEMVLTLGLCLGFGFYQLWDLRREKAKDAAKAAEKAAVAASNDGARQSPAKT